MAALPRSVNIGGIVVERTDHPQSILAYWYDSPELTIAITRGYPTPWRMNIKVGRKGTIGASFSARGIKNIISDGTSYVTHLRKTKRIP